MGLTQRLQLLDGCLQMMLNKILQYRKGRAPSDQKCLALNTSGGYISGFVKHTLSIRAFGDPLVRARKAGV